MKIEIFVQFPTLAIFGTVYSRLIKIYLYHIITRIYKLIQNIESYIVCELSKRDKTTRFLITELRIRKDNGKTFLSARWLNDWHLLLIFQNSWARSPKATLSNYNFAWTFNANTSRILTQCFTKKTKLLTSSKRSFCC